MNMFKRYRRFLVWIAPCLALMGITAGLVSNSWGVVPSGFLIAAIITSSLWLLFLGSRSTGLNKRGGSRRKEVSRSTQSGTNALIATLSVFVILGLVNFLAVRYPTRVDLTETGLYTLAPQSRQLVKSLQQPVKVWVFERDAKPEDRALLENYRQQGQNFSYEYVDPQIRLGLANKFNVQSPGEIYLEAGEQRRLLQNATGEQRLTETRLTNALQQITSNSSAKVYFVQGHGEQPLTGEQNNLSQALGALTDKNYTSQALNLAQTTIPQDASVVVIVGARRGLLPSEVTALSDYVNRGGSLFLAIDPTINLGIDSLLKNWGVTLDSRLAVNPSGAAVGFGPAVILVDNYGQHPITKDFGNGISLYRGARPIETTIVEGVQAIPLLLTSPQSWAESDLKDENLQFDPKSDRTGPLTLGVALSRPATASSNNKLLEARLVVIGNSDFITNNQFSQQLNGDVFINSIGWLSKQEGVQQLSVRPKEAKNRRINLQASQSNILSWTALGFVPLIGFISAFVLWWLRR